MAQFGFFESCAAESSEPRAAHVGETSAQGAIPNNATQLACRLDQTRAHPALQVLAYPPLPHVPVSHTNSREGTLNRTPAAKCPTQLAGFDLSELVKTSSYF